jgi:hypothetical protein
MHMARKSSSNDRPLTMDELKSAIFEWHRQKPEVFTERELERLMKRTVLKRFGNGHALLDQVKDLLGRLRNPGDPGRDREIRLGLVKIDAAVGALDWGAVWENSSTRAAPPPILWNAPAGSKRRNSQKKAKSK